MISLNYTLKKSSPYFLESLNALIVLRFEQEQYQEARKLSEEFLEICRENFDAEDPITLTCAVKSGFPTRPFGRKMLNLKRSFKRSSTFSERTLGPDHPASISSLNSLAVAMNFPRSSLKSRNVFSKTLCSETSTFMARTIRQHCWHKPIWGTYWECN